MGMYATLAAVTPQEAAALKQLPGEVTGLLGIEPDKPGLIGRIFGKKPEPAPVYTVDWGELEDRPQVDLDKNWSILHTLLTGGGLDVGEGSTEGFIIHGGSAIGDIDVGYGPANLFSTAEAQEVLQVIAPIDPEWLEQRWDLGMLKRADAYPSVWDDLDAQEAAEWREDLAVLADELKDFLSSVIERGESFVLWVW